MDQSKRQSDIEFLNSLSREFPPESYSLKPDDLENYGKDWTKVVPPKPLVVIFPRSTDEVVKIVRLCNQFEVPLVPSGGRTGLSGGALAPSGEAVLSFQKMNRIGTLEPLSQTIRVQAGVITEAIHQYCAPYGLTWPVDFSSKGSSHVGGNISTNAGGVKVIHYGMTREWVLGLQVVTMAGSVLELNGSLEKNNTGLDLRQLFIGTEGTLGIITEATLRLARLPRSSCTYFFAVEGMKEVLNLFYHARQASFQIMAYEALTHNCYELTLKHLRLRRPFPSRAGAYVLLEVERPESEKATEILDEWLKDLFEKAMVTDGLLAQNEKEAKEIWSIREGIGESLFQTGVVHKNDVSVPISGLSDFVNDVYALFGSGCDDFQGYEVFVFGHIGDGNLHINLRKPDALDNDTFFKNCKKSDQELFSLVRKYQGSVSAEHGIGLLKKEFLSYSKSAIEIQLMREVKRVLDPRNLLNPGKIL